MVKSFFFVNVLLFESQKIQFRFLLRYNAVNKNRFLDRKVKKCDQRGTRYAINSRF